MANQERAKNQFLTMSCIYTWYHRGHGPTGASLAVLRNFKEFLWSFSSSRRSALVIQTKWIHRCITSYGWVSFTEIQASPLPGTYSDNMKSARACLTCFFTMVSKEDGSGGGRSGERLLLKAWTTPVLQRHTHTRQAAVSSRHFCRGHDSCCSVVRIHKW